MASINHKLARYFSFGVLSGFLVTGFTGCSSSSHLAPVVNAWTQSRADHSTYRVRRGDTIYSIAWAFGLDYHALAAANNLSYPYAISAGQRLKMTSASRFGKYNYSYKVKKHRKPTTVKKNKISPKKHVRHSYLKHWHWRMPTKGRVVERFKAGVLAHQGIAIAGRVGQLIRAAGPGQVVYSGDGIRGYGNLIIIKHNDHYLSAYAFNQRNLVKVGDRVRSGSVIARMGRNDAGRPILYFEIRRDGRPINPQGVL